MIVQHYLGLLGLYRKRIIVLVAGFTGLAFLGSVVKLTVAPEYTAAASVMVVPTEAEYAFGRDSSGSGGPRAATRSLTATYIEYLKSRPVIEAALAKIESKPSTPAAGSGGRLGAAVHSASSMFGKLFHLLDSGRYVTPDPKSAKLNKLVQAINLQTVADSYILRVEVTLDEPEKAAVAANALAEAYVQRVTEELATSVGQIGGFLQQQIEVREDELKALLARQQQLKTGVDTASVDTDRTRLLTTREAERQKLVDAQADLQVAETELTMLNSQSVLQSGRNLTELSIARSTAESRRDAARQNVALRQRAVDHITATLEALRSKETPLVSVESQLETVRQELTELHNRLLTTDLTRSSALTQVRVIDPASAPDYPSSPRVLVNTALGFLAAWILVAMLVIIADTISDKVKTVADLDRIAGRHSLGVLSPRRPAPDGRSGAADIERRLALTGAFVCPWIGVTGFVDENRIAQARQWLEARLSPGDRAAASNPIVLRPLGPVSAGLRLSFPKGDAPSLVCVVPPGEVSERDLADFRDAVLEAGLPAPSFVLLES